MKSRKPNPPAKQFYAIRDQREGNYTQEDLDELLQMAGALGFAKEELNGMTFHYLDVLVHRKQ